MPAKRKYQLKQRAETQATTRQRIVEAALELHATIGPARTTVMDIAKGAGVERVTVYRHFPDELALFSACSAHYRAQNPPPEMSSWAAIEDPVERLRVALHALYAYYDRVAPMLGNVLRDAETVPAVWQATEPRRRYVAGLRDLLARGWSARGRQRQRLLAALALALDFQTWKRLVRDEEVDPEDAVHMMICLIHLCVSRAGARR
ncbi:MAG TPA: helix-turn-helix domain-containing protein [Propionibacteriaceae bacterium]|nr:helix-turn-helix domain-containing protein [Propionibacteriaceae bacterium]